MEDILFDDDYTGPRWTYGLQLRPLAQAHVPEGWIISSNREHPDYAHGTVDFPFELTEEQVWRYDLVLEGVKE